MAPFCNSSASGYSSSNVTSFANATRLALEAAAPASNTNQPSSQQNDTEKDFFLACSLLVSMFGILVLMIAADLFQKNDGKRRVTDFIVVCSDKAEDVLTNMKGFGRRSESAPAATNSPAVCAPAGVSAADKEGRGAGLMLGPMSNIELVTSPFKVPFMEGITEEGGEKNGNAQAVGH
ncbi:hypothetical protein V8C42DRAFT_65485 [Trichoderma barbatum]